MVVQGQVRRDVGPVPLHVGRRGPARVSARWHGTFQYDGSSPPSQTSLVDGGWTHTVSPNADSQIIKIPNSNALFISHGYDAMRHTSYPRTWVANAAHPSFNPITIVHKTTVPLVYAFCDQLFDQHLCWTNAGMDNLEADGYFHFKMSAEFANLRPAAAKKILDEARDSIRVRPRFTGNGRVAVPFQMNVVNSFEEEVDPWKPVESPILIIDKKEAGSIDWDPTSGHSGKKSIRLTAHHQADRRELFPIGAVCLVKPQTRYKLTGWVQRPGRSAIRPAGT